uniref:Protein tweety homolog n=1 Tax=Macaca fascicularis TaxID=9541 RepID=A0A7N9CQA6_MACFA
LPQSPPRPPGAAPSPPGPRLPPQSPPPTPCLPPAPAPLSPARPRAARAPLDSGGSRSPGVRPAAPSPGGHGGTPGLPALGLGASPPPAARADFQLRPVPSGFAPQEQEYQQALLLVAALAGLGLGLSLIFIAVYLIRFCCCRPPEPPGSKTPSPGGGCVTWSCIVALLAGCIGIGIGFYGNSETSDGVSQLSSALLHANHTLSAIDHLVLETVERLGEAVRTELTTLEEVLEPRTELVAAARGARRQAEAVAQQLQGLAFWQGVPLSPLQVAEDVSFVEEYRMTVMSLLVLVLSWGSMGLEAATAVGLSDFCSNPDPYVLNLTQEETGLSSDILSYYFLCNQAVSNPFQQRLTLSQRALANIHSQLLGLEREAVPQFPSAQKPLLSLEETLNVTEGNFHQLVALLHCRGLHKDYGAALRGLCEDALEGLLFLLLFSLLSAGALATALCSLPRAWALFPPRSGAGEGRVLGSGGSTWGPWLGWGVQPPDGSPSRLSAMPRIKPQ